MEKGVQRYLVVRNECANKNFTTQFVEQLFEEEGKGAVAVKTAWANKKLDGASVVVTGAPVLLKDLNDYLKGGILKLGAIALAVMALILLVPVVGVVIYYALGRSTIPGWQRVTLLVGGPVAYGILLVIGNLVGGVA